MINMIYVYKGSVNAVSCEGATTKIVIPPYVSHVFEERGSASRDAYKQHAFTLVRVPFGEKDINISNKRWIFDGFGDCIPAFAKIYVPLRNTKIGQHCESVSQDG